ncbi:S1C family serine protease [uncultured Holdemanella sp.]|uniref:S1C family serine protease n=1 Tax=uncultured Holdemanella sp. TaxID=1763549 RepID=UPI0025F618EE|nr:trypsin-like peptidase domain-containing protein [uncultured Holdemanella sp.]
MQTPPEFRPKTYVPVRNKILTTIGTIILSAIVGFGAGYAGSHLSNNTDITIKQETQKAKSGTIQVTDVSDIVEKCKDSVVEITTESVSSGNSIFGQYVSQGAGSGVIISEDGYIVTNNHVVNNATSLKVTTTDGTEFDAKIIGTDSQTDLAIIKIDAQKLQAATLGDSDTLQVGDSAIAIGNPLGELGGTVTTGIISATDRQITIDNETMTLLQTDAAINPGNSGGGLFNSDGNLIGIVNAKESSTGIEGLGFAIPITPAKDVITELMQNGSVTSRPALNVSLYDYTSNNQAQNSKYKDGCYIVQIVRNGAADKAGLKQNDRIISFDGQDIHSTSDVKAILKKHKIGDTLKIVVERNSKKVEVEITLQAQTQSN